VNQLQKESISKDCKAKPKVNWGEKVKTGEEFEVSASVTITN
jgi:hypothetical protein